MSPNASLPLCGRLRAPHADQPGFALMELLIVITIIGILASIAIPNYTQYVRRGHRAEAKQVLLDSAAQMERRYTVSNSYAGSVPYSQSPVSGTAKYTISFVGTPTATTYTLQAVPGTAQAGDECGTLQLNQLGQKTVSGATSSAAVCWGR